MLHVQPCVEELRPVVSPVEFPDCFESTRRRRPIFLKRSLLWLEMFLHLARGTIVEILFSS